MKLIDLNSYFKSFSASIANTRCVFGDNGRPYRTIPSLVDDWNMMYGIKEQQTIQIFTSELLDLGVDWERVVPLVELPMSLN